MPLTNASREAVCADTMQGLTPQTTQTMPQPARLPALPALRTLSGVLGLSLLGLCAQGAVDAPRLCIADGSAGVVSNRWECQVRFGGE